MKTIPLRSPAALLAAFLTLASPAQPAPQPAKPALEQVVVVFKTHFDIGYTDLASNVVRRYRTTMIDDALKVVDQSRALPPAQQFAWTLPGWPLSKIMEDWPGQTPDRQRRLRQAFTEGRFVVHALPFTTHTELLEIEDLVRGLGFASRLSRAASLALPRDAKMTDVPCHSWVLPTLLRHAGVDFLHLGCNAASNSPRVPRLFYWEGPDGSRLLTMYTAESYGTGLVPPADWPYKIWLALIHTGDNHGPPTPGEVTKLLDEARQKLPGVKVRIGRLSDFADAILAETTPAERAAPRRPGQSGRRPPESSDRIPIVRGDMPDTWIHGPMCDPAGARLARNVRPAIAAAESLQTLLHAWRASVPDAAPVIARAYEQSLLYGEHTWGGALYWVTKYSGRVQFDYGGQWQRDLADGRFKRLEDSWAEHTSYIETAGSLTDSLRAAQLRALGQSVNASGWRVVVFNPLPYRRNGVASFQTSQTNVSALQATDTSEVVPVHAANGVSRFVATALPPMGYRTFIPVKARLQEPRGRIDAAKAEIESPFFKAALDYDRGAVRSLVDKRTGRELVDASAAHGFGQYLYEQFDSNHVAAYVKAYVKIKTDWAINELGKPNLSALAQFPYRAESPRRCSGELERNSTCVAATIKSRPDAALPHAVTMRLLLYENLPLAELEITLHEKPATPRPEAGWLCLPFKIDSPQFRLGRQGSIVDPVTDIVPGANRNLFGINTGVAIFDPQGRGAGLCAIDNPLVSLDEPGCWQYSLDFVPRRPVVYINLFNNQWTTNFRLWNQGTWTARVRLWSFDKFDPETSLITPSLDARFPLEVAVADGPAGNLPPAQDGLSLSRPGVLVSAFGSNPDGAGTVLRLWELAGQSGRCEVRLPAAFTAQTVQPVNLRGQPQRQPIAVARGAFAADLRAFAPASFVIAE